jgi:hypothetical protein
MTTQHLYGYVISKNDSFIVREKIFANGNVQIVVHQIVNGIEQRPARYIAGLNLLEYCRHQKGTNNAQ